MNRVIFVGKDQKERPMKRKLAEHLVRAGKGIIRSNEYMTRDMVSAKTKALSVPEPSLLNATAGAVKLAEETGVDLAQVEGTGKEGAITVSDVKKAKAETE